MHLTYGKDQPTERYPLDRGHLIRRVWHPNAALGQFEINDKVDRDWRQIRHSYKALTANFQEPGQDLRRAGMQAAVNDGEYDSVVGNQPARRLVSHQQRQQQRRFSAPRRPPYQHSGAIDPDGATVNGWGNL